MAAGEVTGASPEELEEMRAEYRGTPNDRAGIDFETAFCLTRIGKQPEEYEGGERFCRRRAAKLSEEEWSEEYPDEEYEQRDPRCYHPSCQFHGRRHGCHTESLPDDRGTANLKHGMYASDERLREDFSEADERLYQEILDWAEVYDFPPREEDPARWKLLEKLAINEVRSVRGYLYIYDEGEVQLKDVYNDDGIVIAEDEIAEENALSKEYRLLQSTLLDIMKELGITPKESSKLSAAEKEADASAVLADVAKEALSDDNEYEPDKFEG